MTETDHGMLAAAMAVIYLIGPAAVGRMTNTVAQRLLIALALIWVS